MCPCNYCQKYVISFGITTVLKMLALLVSESETFIYIGLLSALTGGVCVEHLHKFACSV